MSGTGEQRGPASPQEQQPRPAATPAEMFWQGVRDGNPDAVKRALGYGVSVNAIDPATGLTALHFAVGLNDLALTRFLIEHCGAAFGPDRFGRWPTLVAAECGVDDELSDYIVAKEAAFLARKRL